MCKTNGCKKQATFGYEYKKYIACGNCKKPGMKNVRHLYCLCGKIAKFCRKDNIKPMYCINCKTNDMINVGNERFYNGKTQVYLKSNIRKDDSNRISEEICIYAAKLLLNLKYS